AVIPSNSSFALGTNPQFTATGTFSDSTTLDLTTSVTWSSSSTAVATVSNAPGSNGLATSVAAGQTTITAIKPSSGIFGSTTLTVTAAVLVSIVVTPTNPLMGTGSNQQFTAMGTFSDTSVQDLTSSITWTSSSTAVATVSNAPGSNGLANGVAVGQTTITAIKPSSGIFGSTAPTVILDISRRGAASASAASGVLSLAISTPAGTTAGDVMIASIAVRPNTAAITVPGGWTLVRRVDTSSGNGNSLAVYLRVAAAGDAASHTWVFSSSTGSAGGIATFRGVDTASPVEVENGQTTPSSLTHGTPSVTTTTPRTMLVTSHNFASSATWTPPTGMTEAFDVASHAVPSPSGISLEGTYAIGVPAGASGGRIATASNSTAKGNAHILALRRAP
ncbi:MAG: Ig-like domain-containing protein, partial [Planctomycetota bacterium]